MGIDRALKEKGVNQAGPLCWKLCSWDLLWIWGIPQDRRIHTLLGEWILVSDIKQIGIAPADSSSKLPSDPHTEKWMNAVLILSDFGKNREATQFSYTEGKGAEPESPSGSRTIRRSGQTTHIKHHVQTQQLEQCNIQKKKNKPISAWKKHNPRKRIKVLLLRTLEKFNKNLN